MNVMKWTLVPYSHLKSDLKFPEFLESSSKSRSLPLAWAIGDQLISSFESETLTQALSVEVADGRSHVDYFFEIHPRFTLAQFGFLAQSPLFASIFDEDYFFSRWGKGQQESLKELLPVVSALSAALLAWLHEKDLQPADLNPLKTLPLGKINFIAKVFLQARPSKSEGVQILELVTDLCLMSLSEEQILAAFDDSANSTLIQLKILRYPQTHQRDLASKEKLKISWPKNIQARYQRRGDKAGFDVQMFVASSADLKKTVTHLEKVVEEWKSLSQEQ